MKSQVLRAILFFPRRVVWFILALLVVTALIFAFWRGAASDPTRLLGPDAPREQMETLRRELGLDQPVWEQYPRYIGRVLQGDFGLSVRSRRPVVEDIGERLPSTLRLLGLSIPTGIVLSLLIILIGTFALRVRDRAPVLGAILQRLGQVGVAAGAALPVFLLGLFLLILFAFRLEWLPMGGWDDPRSGRSFELDHAVLPVLTLAILPACLVARSVLGEIVRFRSRPSGSRGAQRMHAVLSFFEHGLIQVIGMLGGVLLVESVFALPGIGRLFVGAIQGRDFFLMHGLVYLFLALAVVLRALAGLVHGADGFVRAKLRAGEPEAAAPTPVERPGYVKALGWLWVVFCLLLVIVPFAQGIGGYLTAGDRVLTTSPGDANLPPGSESVDGFTYRWGTDALGRDVCSRALYALGVDLGSSLLLVLAVLISALLGGLLTGYLARRGAIWADLLDDLLMFPVDVVTTLPGLILLAFVLAITGPGLLNLLVWLSLIYVLPRCVRIVRDWWVAASPKGGVWLRLVGVVLGIVVFGTGLAAVTQPVFGFLGLGVQPPTPDLGTILAEGVRQVRTVPDVVLRPGWAFLSAALGCFLLADTLLSKSGIHTRKAWLELNR